MANMSLLCRESELTKVASMDAYNSEFTFILHPSSVDNNDSSQESFPHPTQSSSRLSNAEINGDFGTRTDSASLPDDIESKIGAIEEYLQAIVLLVGCALRCDVMLRSTFSG